MISADRPEENLSPSGKTPVDHIMLLSDGDRQLTDLMSQLKGKGIDCNVSSASEPDIIDKIITLNPDAILIPSRLIRELAGQIKKETSLPMIGLLGRDTAKGLALDPNLADFMFEPYPVDELELRLKRILKTPNDEESEIMSAGDLTIDSGRGKVTVSGHEVILTFKEYELLKFFVLNRGRVFTREVLLDKVWGYNYFGGDRTVDVHIRRLRSKIEDATHTFIETVRSIGYRFKE